MTFLVFGAIPRRALPLFGWTNYSLPGGQIPKKKKPDTGAGGIGGEDPVHKIERHKQILREDKDILEFISIIVQSGILN